MRVSLGVRALWWRAIELYYMATPLFLALDVVLGAPVRVAGLGSQGFRYAYYLVLMALGLLCRARPRIAPTVGVLESSTNLVLLILAILGPYWSMADAVLAGTPTPEPASAWAWWNFAISAPVLYLSLKRSERALARQVGMPERGPRGAARRT